MTRAEGRPNRRILLIDDSPAIHEDFRKVLATEEQSVLAEARAAFLGEAAPAAHGAPRFEIDSSYQGEEGLTKLRAALAEGRPYALAFVDVRMPPGWDGIETIERLWQEDALLQVVICTAYSDFTWEETFARLGRTDRLLILKKPFDPIEISQLAAALTEKWNVERRARVLVEELQRKEQEARAYASSLETVNRALETSKAAAEKSSEMKTDFLVHLSHEICSKVSDVLGEVELLRTPGAERELPLAQLDSVFHSSRYLLGTLEEVADIALIDSGRLELNSVAFNPLDPLREVAAEHRARAEAKDLELRVEYPDTLPSAVVGDPVRIRQILRNLVANAVLYTERGSIRVALTAEPAPSWRGTTLTYEVEDSGLGIPRHRLGRIFEPFSCSGGNTLGAGLGLAHSQRLARLLGGDIVAESETGKGSRFQLILSVALQQEASRAFAAADPRA